MPGTDTKKNMQERPVDRDHETQDREYKSKGLPQTEKYSVDKKIKGQPSVSTPEDIKEQSGLPE